MERINGYFIGFACYVGLILLGQSVAVAADSAPTIEECSIVSLIATPEKYDGKFIRTWGVARTGYHINGIFLSRESAENTALVNGVLLVFDDSEIDDIQKNVIQLKWISVIGEFHAPEPGRSGWRGYINKIIQLYDPTTMKFSD